MRALIAFALCSCAHVSPVPAPAPAGFATPEAAVAAYLRAGDEHASRLVRAAFHPAIPIQSVDAAGEPRALAQIAWWPKIDAPGPPATTRAQRLLDRSGPLALIGAVSSWDTHAFDDLLVVARAPGGWRIVGKVFARYAAGETIPGDAADAARAEAEIRAVIARKIEAHAAYDPALLAASHLADCRYAFVDDRGLAIETLSEHAASYAAKREAGITDRESPWRVLSVRVRGSIAAVVTDVIWQGRRHVDHLLLLRTAAGWRIAAAAWGPV